MISKVTAQSGPFTPSQIQQYVDHIGLPEKYHPQNDPARNIELLTALHIHQISTIPYENLSLHYSSCQARTISLDPQHLFDKIVIRQQGRGGYCKGPLSEEKREDH